MDNNPDWEQRKAAAEKELQAVCEKHKVNVVPYIDALGPKLTIIDTSAQPKNDDSGSQPAEAGDKAPNPAPKVSERSDSNPVAES